MNTKRYSIDMCSSPLASSILLFALPLVASNMLQLAFNLADVVVVGKFAGDLSQAAVTSTTSLVNLLLSLFFGLSGGTNVVVAHALGSKQEHEVSDIVHTSVTLAAVSGICLAVVGIVSTPTLLSVMKSPPAVIGLSSLYLRIYFLGVPASIVYNFASAILRANGDTRRPLYFLTLAGVVNVVLNLILVIVFHMDVAGVAIATAVSQWLSAFLVLRCLILDTGLLHLDVKQLRIHTASLARIARIGIPAGITTSVFSLSNVAIQSSINSLGEVVMAGSGAASSIENISYNGMAAFYHACTSFVSQNYGARRLDRVDRSCLLCHLYSLITALLFMAAILIVGPTLLHVFTDSPEVIEQGMIRLRYISVFQFLCGAMDICSAALRGMGWSLFPMAVTLTGVCGLRLVWISTVFRANSTSEVLYIIYPISWTLTTVVHTGTILVARRRARKKLAAEQQSQEQIA